MSRLATAAALLLAAGCRHGPIEPYDSPNFTRPPEIWEREGGYHLRVYEVDPSPVGTAPPAVETVDGEVRVYISLRHSSGGKANRLFDLGVPSSTPPPRFLWLNPDGTRNAMEIVRR